MLSSKKHNPETEKPMKRFLITCKNVPENIVFQNKKIRVTLLTPRLIRIEKDGKTDLPTQTVWNRDLGVVRYEKELNANTLTVQTDEVTFHINISTGKLEKITFSNGMIVTDFSRNILPGTARTLDMVNGATKLEPGIMSRSGASVMNDSKSLLLCDGQIIPRPVCSDLYYFAYGHDYRRQLEDFFRLTGPVPLIPKYALGNWWSRYRAYTQEEYRALMKEFIARKLPVTVATIDMDWHWVDVMERFGEKAKPEKPKCKEEALYNLAMPGWTGYTWNTELFPDHKELLDWLHAQGFHVTLNVHPSQGIRYFEDCYENICGRMGLDPEKRDLVPFDITDPEFLNAYFEEAHHPLEREGVDFWWLDWQQGKNTKIPGLDPLWALNHYHTLDGAKANNRPLILSRYAGLGSHRYPLGFSGDTICTWKSLDFQPYFTSTAANAGYTWWSHDIGGHMKGIQDDELYLRWLQFGVFSPINRLHSSNSDFMGKEPWHKSWAVSQIANRFLRLRHKLIPLLYSAAYETHTDGTPICMPMYYLWDCEESYQVRNQYVFAGQLLVCPITTPADKKLNLAKVKVWLPEGRWTDIFNGRIYRGGCWVTMYRDLDSIPVLAPEGAIVPMYKNADTNDLSLEQPHEIHIWRGNGEFELYEDDGETKAYEHGKHCVTVFKLTETDNFLTLTITPPAENYGLWQGGRKMEIHFRDITDGKLSVNGEPRPFEPTVSLDVHRSPIVIQLQQITPSVNPDREMLRTSLLTRVQCGNDWKLQHFGRDKQLPEFVQDAMNELDAMIY